MADSPQFTDQEQQVFALARDVLEAPGFQEVRDALQEGRPTLVTLAGILIQVDPGFPFSGLTNFKGNGFYLGLAAAQSQMELQKTVFHEVYRLRQGAQAGGVAAVVDGELARVETELAFDFAERAFALYFKKANERPTI